MASPHDRRDVLVALLVTLRISARTAAALSALLALAVGLSVWPVFSFAATVLVALLVTLRISARTAAALSALLVIAVGLSVWPVFTFAATVLVGVAVLAWLAPAWAFIVTIPIFGAEGWLKGMLISTGAPFSGHEVPAGAALLDLALALGVGGLLIADRGETLRALWHRLDRLTRIGVALLGGWIVLSLCQVFQSGQLSRGVDGFRLTQAYLTLAVAGAVLLYGRADPSRLVRALLFGLGSIASYAALRALVGPSTTERWFALSRPGTTQYGDIFRSVGSFSGAVGLASFVVPAGVFAYGLALLSPRHRVLAMGVFATAGAATVASYSRAGIVGLGFGVILISAVGLRAAFSTPRQRRIASAAILGVLVVGAGATVLAGRVSPATRTRTSGLINPFRDASMRMRFKTWHESFDEILRHPLGTGLGTVGSASGISGGSVVTFDNSLLKIGREQGFEGAFLFMGGLAALSAAILRRIGRLCPEPRAIAASSLGGLGAFLVMCVFGEFIEQPGKVVGWTLLGLAVSILASSRRPPGPSLETAQQRPYPPSTRPRATDAARYAKGQRQSW